MLALLAQAFAPSPDVSVVATWSVPVLSVAALAGGYAFLIRSLTSRVERLEARLDAHIELPGHPVLSARVEDILRNHAALLHEMKRMTEKLDAVQSTLAGVVGELRSKRGADE